MLNASHLCPRFSNKQSATLRRETDDDSVESDSQAVGSSVQGFSSLDESSQRLTGVSIVVEEVQDQPLPNSHLGLWTPPPGVTTFVVRHLPAMFSLQKLLEAWPPDGTYTFLYYPWKWTRLGFAFINMTSHEAATEFIARWHGQ